MTKNLPKAQAHKLCSTKNYLMMLFGALLLMMLAIPLQAYGADSLRSTITQSRDSSLQPLLADMLRKNPELQETFRENPEFVQEVLKSPSLQRQLLDDLGKSRRKSQVLSSYVDRFNAQKPAITTGQRGVNHGIRTSSDGNSSSRQPVQRLGGVSQAQLAAAIEALNRATQARNDADTQKAETDLSNAAADISNTGIKPDNIPHDISNSVVGAVIQNTQARQQIIEQFMGMLEKIAPSALQLFLADTVMQQQILDGEFTLLEVAAQLGITNRDLLSSIQQLDAQMPDPIIAQDGGGDDGNGVVHTVTSINHIPAEDRDFDDNGWPTHLRVPDGCPGPQAGINYTHYWREAAGSNSTNVTQVRTPFRDANAGGHRKIAVQASLEGSGQTQEKVAIPMITSPSGNFMNRIVMEQASTWPRPQSGFGFSISMSVSYCPGDFTGITPEGKTPLADNCVRPGFGITMVNQGSQHSGCELANGERYFFNVQDVHQTNLEVQGTPKPAEVRNLAEANYVMVGLVGASSVAEAGDPPPYAGPCLEDGPYPMNYSGKMSRTEEAKVPNWAVRGGQENIYSHACGRSKTLPRQAVNGSTCAEIAQSPTAAQATLYTSWRCYDAFNQHPPKTFTRECVNNNQLVWTEGYNEPVTSSYVCEVFKGPDAVEPTRKVCAAHREGESHYGKTCIFDEERDLFRWQ